MQLVFDPRNIFDHPWPYYQVLIASGLAEDGRTAKRQASDMVLAYVDTLFSEPRRILISRRWSHAGQHGAEFVVRPDPEIVAKVGKSPALALVCRLNREAGILEVTRGTTIAGEADPERDYLFEGTFVRPNVFGRVASDFDALEFLSHLPEAGTDIDVPLREWSKYLVWRQKLAEEKANRTYAYTEWESDRETAAKFFLTEPDAREKLKLRFVNESLRATAGADAQARSAFQGEFRRIESAHVRDPIRGRGHYHSREVGDPLPEKENLVVTLSLRPGESVGAKSDIPERGFLRLAMEGELAAVDIQQNGLQRLAEGRSCNPNLRNWLFDIRKAMPVESRSVTWAPEQVLNLSQRECVEKALVFDDLLLLWGPPGTGKTTVIAEIAAQFCRRGERVLISSQANLAVDQALGSLPRRPHVRPVRISTSKKKEGLDADLHRWIDRWLRSVAVECRNAVADEADSDWKELLMGWTTHLEKMGGARPSAAFEKHYLKRANVVGATCLETGKPEFRSGVRFGERFDLTIVDEVSKATPPELLLPALQGRRTLLVGDHRQLPPVFKDSTFPEAIENGVLKQSDFDAFRGMVTTSLFEHYYRDASASVRCGLAEQFRMHPHIMGAVNLFYADSPLTAGGGDAERTKQRSHGFHLRTRRGRPWLLPGKHLVWVDTACDELGAKVNDERVGTSRRNLTEAKLSTKLLQDLRSDDVSIGIISFYRAQIQAIEYDLWDSNDRYCREFVEAGGVNTVDQFQGSERDVIIVSLARTDYPLTGEFVTDFRRINVALSRAKRLLIIMGSSRTFGSGVVKVPSRKDGSGEAARPYLAIWEMASRVGSVVTTADLLSPIESQPWQRSKPSK